MIKISEQVKGVWVDRDCAPIFTVDLTSSGAERVVVALPADASSTFRSLALTLPDPVQILYVLHTSRGEGAPGRYQSAEIDAASLDRFLVRFESFLAGDARCDLWVRSVSFGSMIVWDRHNVIFGYGDTQRQSQHLRELGFGQGSAQKLGLHQHNYRLEFDDDASDLLAYFQWSWVPLREEDEQSPEVEE